MLEWGQEPSNEFNISDFDNFEVEFKQKAPNWGFIEGLFISNEKSKAPVEDPNVSLIKHFNTKITWKNPILLNTQIDPSTQFLERRSEAELPGQGSLTLLDLHS